MRGVSRERVVGVVLAGGLSRRMNGLDKALMPFGEGVLLSRTLKRFAPQVESVLLNANGDPARFAGFHLPVIGDARRGYPGPLAGIEAGFLSTGGEWLVSIPVDLPFLPLDLVARLVEVGMGCGLPTVAGSGGRMHPVVCLWPRSALPAIRKALDGGDLRMLAWFANHPHRTVWFDCPPGGVDPFFNVNHPEALAAATALAFP
ncbi:MAG: molybdenum cofactor guanylyltransferase [Magnetococcales bacterium]|nr:molybdenum cofactor guanylyltransferase [Magnetococcales bacterium]